MTDADAPRKLVQVRGKSGMMLTVKPARGGEDALEWLIRISDEIVSDETRELMKQLPPDVFDQAGRPEHPSNGAGGSMSE